LFPGIAVAESLKEIDPAGEVRFIGSERGLEEEILKREGFPRETLAVGRIKGEGWKARVRTVLKLPASFWAARGILIHWMPDVVLGIGGYSSGPVILAAFFGKIRRAILEPNAIPGFTNRILGRFVNRIFIAFPETARFFPGRKVRVTGTPVRRELTRVGARLIAPLQSKPFTILVIGGSQGATALNRAMVDLLPELERSGRPFRIVHQTGKTDFEWVREAYGRTRIPHTVNPFIADIASAYREVDLVVSRAGASTVAELIETRTPAILVPYPHAADDHQRFNALSVVRGGGAEMILNKDLAGLGERIFYYEACRDELGKMRERLGEMRKVPAAEAIARECIALAK
jgi:UDP-N-acetylglucosamine--N-acetylmuramyl-(pentapeptide) pyrophosphoryl-undecaprenol N-acetylglucosamine transferase